MLRRLIFPILLGLSGCGVLIGLGVWQVNRLAENRPNCPKSPPALPPPLVICRPWGRAPAINP